MSDTWKNDLSLLQGALRSFVQRRGSPANDADDVVQEAVLRALQTARKGEPIGNFRAYLYRIAGNLSIDGIRHRGVRERISGHTLDCPEALAIASAEPSAEQMMMERQRKAAFDAALAKLPDRQRQALVLSRIEGWPYARIADHLGCSAATVFNDVKMAMRFVMAQTSDLDL